MRARHSYRLFLGLCDMHSPMLELGRSTPHQMSASSVVGEPILCQGSNGLASRFPEALRRDCLETTRLSSLESRVRVGIINDPLRQILSQRVSHLRRSPSPQALPPPHRLRPRRTRVHLGSTVGVIRAPTATHAASVDGIKRRFGPSEVLVARSRSRSSSRSAMVSDRVSAAKIGVSTVWRIRHLALLRSPRWLLPSHRRRGRSGTVNSVIPGERKGRGSSAILERCFFSWGIADSLLLELMIRDHNRASARPTTRRPGGMLTLVPLGSHTLDHKGPRRF